MKQGYALSTTMGDTLLESHSHVYVQVSPRKYLRKNVPDVNIGDLVLFEKPYASTELRDVEPHLTKSPRYQKAKEVIHEQNNDGLYVPKLRVLLTEGMADHDVISREYVRERALFEEEDFTDIEYGTMTGWMKQILLSNDTNRHEDTVESWIRGETLSPSDWDIYRVLEKHVNPAFSQFRKGDETPDSMYFNYRVYTAIRSGIMRFLNNCRGTPESRGDNWDRESRISLSPEYAIVFQHFMNHVTADYATARVVGKKHLKNRRDTQKEQRTNLKLSGGVIRKEINGFEGSLKSYYDVLQEYTVLEMFLHAEVEDYLTATKLLEASRDRHVDTVTDVWVASLPYLYEIFDEPLDPELEQLKLSRDGCSKQPYIAEHVKQVVDAILLGHLDDALSMERGTSLRLLESKQKLRRALPHDYFTYLVSVGDTTDFTRESERKIEKLKKKLKRKNLILDIGLPATNRIFLSQEIEAMASAPKDGNVHKRTMRWYLQRGAIEDGVIRNAIGSAERDPNLSLWTRKETQRILGEHRLDNIIHLRESDFIWEDI